MKFICVACGHNYEHAGDLQSHVCSKEKLVALLSPNEGSTSPSPEIIKCIVCNSIFDSEAALITHTEESHKPVSSVRIGDNHDVVRPPLQQSLQGISCPFCEVTSDDKEYLKN